MKAAKEQIQKPRKIGYRRALHVVGTGSLMVVATFSVMKGVRPFTVTDVPQSSAQGFLHTFANGASKSAKDDFALSFTQDSGAPAPTQIRSAHGGALHDPGLEHGGRRLAAVCFQLCEQRVDGRVDHGLDRELDSGQLV